jgi:uncharacterized protein DUF1569
MAQQIEAVGAEVKRRSLHFDDLLQVVADAKTMASRPHRSLGNWTLAQVCKHLADTIHGSIDGIRLDGHRLRRVLLGRRILAWTYRHGIPPGVTLDPKLNPPVECVFESAYAELERAIARYRAFDGRLRPHPVFGRLKRSDWDRLHCFHCAHHLSFIVTI